MTKFMKYLILSATLCVAAFAQTATTSTTLSAALTHLPTIDNQQAETSVTLANATNVSANGFLYSDGEVMSVNSTYSSGTTVPVRRGVSGTRAVTHLSGATVYVFAPGQQARAGLINYDLYGGCTRSTLTLLPIVNSDGGIIVNETGGGGISRIPARTRSIH